MIGRMIDCTLSTRLFCTSDCRVTLWVYAWSRIFIPYMYVAPCWWWHCKNFVTLFISTKTRMTSPAGGESVLMIQVTRFHTLPLYSTHTVLHRQAGLLYKYCTMHSFTCGRTHCKNWEWYWLRKGNQWQQVLFYCIVLYCSTVQIINPDNYSFQYMFQRSFTC